MTSGAAPAPADGQVPPSSDRVPRSTNGVPRSTDRVPRSTDRVPRSTYRIQVRPDFDLDATAALVPYLDRLGVTHVYSAPLLTATAGSVHGYDVVDPTAVNPQLGGEAALDRLSAALRERSMGLVVDIVPNHLGVADTAANRAWWSVLRDGPDSTYAAWFDIDWARGPLLIPVLGDDSLDDVRIDGDELRYFEHRYPLAPGTGGGSVVDVHARQHYRLVNWRRANAELTYRRFFGIADLAGVRVEDPDVFDATHAEILRWTGRGIVDGLRVDHPDGLRDPAEYLRRLRAAAPSTWVVVEKILAYREELPGDWPVAGTTGYDALREVCGLFIDPDGERYFPARTPYSEAEEIGKREAATELLATELTRLEKLAPGVPRARDALAEIAVWLGVYRTYLPLDRDYLDAALATASAHLPEAVAALTPTLTDGDSELAQRFQQYTGAVMAKGVEDTAFYRWTRFVALNEVGGAPDRFGVAPEEFHVAAARRRSAPAGMTTLSTHDTKRSEDVRARLAVLSEIGDRWHATLRAWHAAAPLDDDDLADLAWQTAIGAWPNAPERMRAYLVKAAREAGTRTTWAAPDAAFESAIGDLVDAMYGPMQASIDAFVASIEPAGWSNALGQKLVQLTMPGVPDTYQGTELWDDSLVDPDNRRPVDFAARSALLDRLDEGWLPPLDRSGAAKMLVTSRALRLIRDWPSLFKAYSALDARGPHANHVFGFDRGGALTVVTRLPIGLEESGGWHPSDDVLVVPGAAFEDALTGRRLAGPAIAVAELFDALPVALLVRSDGAADAGGAADRNGGDRA